MDYTKEYDDRRCDSPLRACRLLLTQLVQQLHQRRDSLFGLRRYTPEADDGTEGIIAVEGLDQGRDDGPIHRANPSQTYCGVVSQLRILSFHRLQEGGGGRRRLGSESPQGV